VKQIPVPGGAIGWPGAGSDAVAELDLQPGDALLLYTDGLVEANKDIIEGTESLMQLAMELRELPADRLAGGLVHRTLRDGDRRDDSLALVIRREPAVVRARWTIGPDRTVVAGLRHELVEWLVSQSVGGSDADDMALIATELLSNAVVAAQSSVNLHATVERDPGGATVAVEVEDDGTGRIDLDRLGTAPPHLDADAGRGLFIVRRLSDQVTILSTSEGSIVRAVRHVRLVPPGLGRGAETVASARFPSSPRFEYDARSEDRTH
jgi:anti-sigma regulatory factor (Ser/Thr protein kinase)